MYRMNGVNANLKEMSAIEIKTYIRRLEGITNSEPLDEDTLDALGYFGWTELVTTLENKRNLKQMLIIDTDETNTTHTQLDECCC